MSTEQFRQMLDSLMLLPSGKRTARLLGLSLRQLQRISSGKAPVPKPVALLLMAYVHNQLEYV